MPHNIKYFFKNFKENKEFCILTDNLSVKTIFSRKEQILIKNIIFVSLNRFFIKISQEEAKILKIGFELHDFKIRLSKKQGYIANIKTHINNIHKIDQDILVEISYNTTKSNFIKIKKYIFSIIKDEMLTV